MTYTYTFDNTIILQQIGSAYIDNATAIEMLRLNEEGWTIDAVHNYPQGDRCYVILSKPDPLPEGMLFHTEAEANKWIEQFADVVFNR